MDGRFKISMAAARPRIGNTTQRRKELVAATQRR